MELINHLAEHYAGTNTSPEDELLQQVANFTKSNHAHAHMLSGHVQGTFLTILSTLLRPLRILEIGTFTGYSALCLAKGLQSDGLLHTIELREEDAMIANTYIPFITKYSHYLTAIAKAGLTVTLFLIGCGLSRKALQSVGFKPLIQGVILWAIISVVALWAVTSFAH